MLLFRPLFRPLRGRGRGFLLFIFKSILCTLDLLGDLHTSSKQFYPLPSFVSALCSVLSDGVDYRQPLTLGGYQPQHLATLQ